MNRFLILLACALLPLATAAKADDLLAPGQWKVTSNIRMNGAMVPPQIKARCLGPEQTGDVRATFGPQMGTINSKCEPAVYEESGKTLKWHMQCRGQLDMEIIGYFNFDTPQHYSATVASKGWMAGALISDVKTELVGERVGECQN